jgi:N-acyl-D-amino-acid deacylase
MAQPEQVIDAAGKIVAPGFIDAHAHGNPLSEDNKVFHNFLAMGVTTICLGQDGSSPRREDLRPWMDEVDEAGPGVNVVPFVGHATVRRLSGAELDPNPTDEQLAKMAELVADAMDAGCFGLTTGLEYSGGRPASDRELAAVATPVGERGGLVMSHMRTEDDDAVESAIDELVNQGRAGNSAVHVSHIKVVSGHGAARAEEILAHMERARQEGVTITADIYPYTASSTGIGIVFPDWALPPNDYDEVVATRRDELAAYLRERIAFRNGPEATLIGSGQWAGKTLAEIAEELEKPFEDVLIDDLPPGSVSGAYFVMDEELQARLLVDPHVMICSDGSPTSSHPRGHGAFARVIHHFVYETEQLTLEEAVHKMTGLPAATIGLDAVGRGTIAAGNAADIVIFDPHAVNDAANFVEPRELAEGFDTVIVNGQVARLDGEFTDVGAGRVLRRPAAE